MIFENKEELKLFLKNLIFIDSGIQGTCYYNTKENLVYKIFHDWYLEDFENPYSQNHILQFLDIKNNTFIFPIATISYHNQIIGYITNYVESTNLYKIDPLYLSFNELKKIIKYVLDDITLISKEGICIYDMMYNIMLGNHFYIIDTLEYSRSNKDSKELFQNNVKAFNLEIMYFLVDGYFNHILDYNRELKEMLESKGKGISIVEFIEKLQNYLSGLVGKEIENLSMAQEVLNKTMTTTRYIREKTLKKVTI